MNTKMQLLLLILVFAGFRVRVRNFYSPLRFLDDLDPEESVANHTSVYTRTDPWWVARRIFKSGNSTREESTET